MSKKQKNYYSKLLVIFTLVLIAIDQLSKAYFIELFEQNPEQSISLGQFASFTYIWNQGVAFGFFSNWEFSNLFFIIFSSLITIYFIRLFLHESNKSLKFSYMLVISGAVGNIIDRIRYGAVFDFIDLHIRNYHWPAFNLADTFITIGGFFLVYNLFFTKVKHNEQNKI